MYYVIMIKLFQQLKILIMERYLRKLFLIRSDLRWLTNGASCKLEKNELIVEIVRTPRTLVSFVNLTCDKIYENKNQFLYRE